MPSLLKSFPSVRSCCTAVVRNSKSMQIRVLHQANACDFHSLHGSPEEFLLRYGSKLTPHLVSSYITDQGDPELAYRLFALARRHHGYRHNGLAYNAILRALCSAREFNLLEKMLKDMKEESCDLRETTFGFTLRLMSKEGLHQETTSLFNRMADFGCKPTALAYKAVLNSFVYMGNNEEALRVFTAMRDADVYPDSLLVGMLTSGLCKASKVKEAAKVVESVIGIPGCVDSLTLNGIVGYLYRAGRSSDVYRILEKAKEFKVPRDAITYNKLMNVLCNANKVDEAVRLLEEMSEDSINPTVVTLNTLLVGFAKQARVDEALLLFVKMSRTLEADAISFSILVNALCRRNRYREACMLVSEMSRKNLSPSMYTYTAIVHGLFQLGKVEGAWQILKDMKEGGVIADTVFYNELIRGLCMGNRVDDARRLLVHMTQDGCQPSKHTRSLIMSGLCKAERVSEAVEFGQDMMKSGCEMDIVCWNPILESLCRLGKKEEAFKFLDSLAEHGCVPIGSTYNSMIKGFCAAKKLDEVRKLLMDMKKNGFEADMVTYITLIEGDTHCVPGTVDLFRPVIEGKVVLRIGKYITLIDGLFQSGEVEFALKVFEAMLRVGKITPTVSTFNALVDGLCKNKKLREAEGFFRKMRDYGCSPNTVTYTVLMHGLCNVCDYDAVDLVYKEMKAERGCLPDVVMYGVLLNGFSAGGKFKEMYDVLDDMKVHGCPPNEVALRLLFRNLCLKDSKRVNKYIKAAFGISYTPEDLAPVGLVTGKSTTPTILTKAQDEENTRLVSDFKSTAIKMHQEDASSKGSSEVFKERPQQSCASVTSVKAKRQMGKTNPSGSTVKNQEVKTKLGISEPSVCTVESQEIKFKLGESKKLAVVRKQGGTKRGTKSSCSSATIESLKTSEGEPCQARKLIRKAVHDMREEDTSKRKVVKQGEASDGSHEDSKSFIPSSKRKVSIKRKSVKVSRAAKTCSLKMTRKAQSGET